MKTTAVSDVLEHLKADAPAARERLMELLRIASISTDRAYQSEIARAAAFVREDLSSIGLDARVMETEGHPVVLAKSDPSDALPGAARVLFYGHYDVQPPDPLELWESPPFEPVVRDGAIVARGACDDKGQTMCFVEAVRAWKRAAGGLPVHVTLLIEGEEECGSVHLAKFLREHREELAADVVVISDTSMWDRDTVAITYALRGLVYFDVQLHGPSRDLHSGLYGGTLANPATILTQVLGRLFDVNHRITIPGFYDDVAPVSEAEKKRWEALGFDEARDLLSPIGVAQPFGEAGYSTLERRWARPSCDVNGLYGGYGGEGAKTVIPSFAGAKVSFRIPANMNAKKVAQQFTAWLHSHDTHGLRWKITNHGMANPVAVADDSPFVRAAMRAVETSHGRRPALVREGATIPVVADFKEILGLDSLLIGFGLADDRIHSPNERFDLWRFELGCRTHAALLGELGGCGR